MTKHYTNKGNRIIKFAYLNAIADIMKANATAKFTWLDEGFENDNQRIHFTSEGHKCLLVGVGCPNLDYGDLPLIVETDWEGKPNTRVDVTLNINKIHINTLEKIACEVYDTLRDPEKDDEWDIYKQELISSWLDTHLAR